MSDYNTWPGGVRRALLQSEHEAWNRTTYPGTRQLCEECGEATGNCEDDSLYWSGDPEERWDRDGIGPLCWPCYSFFRDAALEASDE